MPIEFVIWFVPPVVFGSAVRPKLPRTAKTAKAAKDVGRIDYVWPSPQAYTIARNGPGTRR